MAATAPPQKLDPVAMAIGVASSTCINAVDVTKSDPAIVDGKRKTTNDDKSELTASTSSSQVRHRPTKRSDISALISHEMTEMEKRIDVDDADADDDVSDSANNNTQYTDGRDNKMISESKSINPTEMTSISTSIGMAHKSDRSIIGEMHSSNDATNVKWDNNESIKPLHRLFVRSHSNEMVKRQRCDDDCVQIPIERIELGEDDEGIIKVHHDVSSVQSYVTLC